MSAVATSSGATNLKRLRDSSSDDDSDTVQRGKTPRFYYILGPESSTDCSSDSMETNYSIQGHSTDLVKDTSDTSIYGDSTEVEFEVESLIGEKIYPFSIDDESSAPEDDVARLELGVGSGDGLASEGHSSDVSSLGSDDEKRAGAVARRRDGRRSHLFELCLMCREKNSLPLYRFCFRCNKIRKNFFPPRPKMKKKKRKKEEMIKESQQKEENKKEDVEEKLGLDSGLSSGPSGSQESTVGWGGSGVLEGLPSLLASNSSEEPSSQQDQLCGTCCVNPKDGAFVHNKFIHIYSCYKCSSRVLKTIGRCPICNRRVNQVAKVVMY